MQPLDETTFDEALDRAPGLVLVDFWADWCGPCRVVTPILESLSESYVGRVDFYAVNADENRRLMSAFNVQSLPTVIVLQPNQNGPGAKVVAHSVGTRSAAGFAQLLEDALNPPPGMLERLGRFFGRG